MGTNVDKAVKMFVQTVKSANNRKTSPYDVTAKVVRVRGDTVYVHIDGGVDETPVKKTIDAKPGDKVKIRLSGGSGWITGNVTAPPTDDTKTDNFINNEFQYIFNKVENSEFGKGADGKDGKDGDPGAGVEKVEIVYCIADDDQLDEDGEPSMVTDDWQSNVPTIDDIPLDEMEETVDPTDIETIIEDKAYDLGGIVKTVNWVKINGTNFTDYTVEIETDEEGYKSSVIKFADGALPSTISSFVVNYVEGLDPEDIYYIWMRTLTYTTDMEEGDDPEEGVPSIYGTLTVEGGTDFKVRTIIREEKWFCLATDVAIPSGQTFEDIQKTEWSTTIPDIEDAKDEFTVDLFYWTYVKYYYSDGTTAVSPPYYDFSAQIAYEVSQAETSQDNHFWSTKDGAFVGHYENEPDRDHVVRVVGEGVLLYKDGERMASFTDSGVAFRGKVGGTWTELAKYTNLGISFAQNVDYTIGDPAGQYIKWDSSNKRIVICAQSLVYGSNNVDLATELDSVKGTATQAKNTADTANSTASTANTNANSAKNTASTAYDKAVAAQNKADTTSNLIYMSGGGLYVVNSSYTNRYIKITSSGMDVYYGSDSVAFFGAQSRIGVAGEATLTFNNDSIDVQVDTLTGTFGSVYVSSLGGSYFGLQSSQAVALNAPNVVLSATDSNWIIGDVFLSSSVTNNKVTTYNLGMGSALRLGVYSSSRDFKTDISYEIEEEFNPHKLYDIPVVTFRWKKEYQDEGSYDQDKKQIGFIAEDVHDVYYTGAIREPDGKVIDWNYRTLLPAMLKLIQEQHEEIELLKAKVS